MEIQYRPLDAIKPYPGNPRHNEAAIEHVAKSIKEFGWQQPIVVDSGGTIVVGHTRYFAALELGLDEVPVKTETDLTPEKLRAYRIADNKLNELASWDTEKLEDELKAILQDFDPSVIGFSEVELDALFNGVGEWDSDIDAMNRVEAKDSTAKGKLTVSFDEQHREAVKDCITKAIATLKIEGVSIG